MSGARVLSQVDYSISISGARYAVTSAQKSKAYNVYIYYLLFIYQHNNFASTLDLTRCLHGLCSESQTPCGQHSALDMQMLIVSRL